MIQAIALLTIALVVSIAIICEQIATARGAYRRIRYLEQAIEQQEERIAWHVSNSARLEARNTWLEGAVAHYITTRPQCNRRSALVTKREISWN